MGKIFISHAVDDKALVNAFVDFLQTGCGVIHGDIFCSSLEGMNIPEGSSFVSFMEDTLRDAEFVIMIISTSYYESVFCLCELGASWILQHNIFPLLIPPLTWSDLKGVLNSRQGGKINDSSDLANLFDRLKAIGKASPSTARFQVKKDEFINKLKTLDVKPKSRYSAKEYEELKAMYEFALSESAKFETEVSELKRQFDELAEKKDVADVLDVRLSNSDEHKQFEVSVSAFCAASQKLPSAALEAMFSKERGESYILPSYLVNKDAHDAAHDAAERQLIYIEDNEVTLNTTHPLIFGNNG